MENSVQLYIESQRVDLFDNEAITLKRKIQDIKDIKKVFTDFTHVITVPASKANNRIFQHLLRPDIDTLDPRSYKSAVLKINNNSQMEGLVLVEGSKKKSGRFNNYKIRFYGELVQLPQLLSEFYLKDLDLTSFLGGLSENQILSLSTTDPQTTSISGVSGELAENVRFPLLSFSKRFFYDRGSDLYDPDNNEETDDTLADDTRINNNLGPSIDDQDVANIADTPTTRLRAADGIDLNSLKRSLKVDAIIEAMEAKEYYAGGPQLRFSRGLDANGIPTAVASEVRDQVETITTTTGDTTQIVDFSSNKMEGVAGVQLLPVGDPNEAELFVGFGLENTQDNPFRNDTIFLAVPDGAVFNEDSANPPDVNSPRNGDGELLTIRVFPENADHSRDTPALVVTGRVLFFVPSVGGIPLEAAFIPGTSFVAIDVTPMDYTALATAADPDFIYNGELVSGRMIQSASTVNQALLKPGQVELYRGDRVPLRTVNTRDIVLGETGIPFIEPDYDLTQDGVTIHPDLATGTTFQDSPFDIGPVADLNSGEDGIDGTGATFRITFYEDGETTTLTGTSVTDANDPRVLLPADTVIRVGGSEYTITGYRTGTGTIVAGARANDGSTFTSNAEVATAFPPSANIEEQVPTFSITADTAFISSGYDFDPGTPDGDLAQADGVLIIQVPTGTDLKRTTAGAAGLIPGAHGEPLTLRVWPPNADRSTATPLTVNTQAFFIADTTPVTNARTGAVISNFNVGVRTLSVFITAAQADMIQSYAAVRIEDVIYNAQRRRVALSIVDEGVFFLPNQIEVFRGTEIPTITTITTTNTTTGDHFLNTPEHLRAYMLMHTKANTLNGGNKIRFDDRWPDEDGATTRSFVDFEVSPFHRNGRNYRRYYLRVNVDSPGDTTYSISLAQTGTDSLIWTSGEQTGTYTQASQTQLGGRITDGVGSDSSIVSGIRLNLTNTPQQLYFRLIGIDGDLTNLTVNATIIAEDVDGGNFPFYNFSRTVSEFSNTATEIATDPAEQVPKMKLINFLVGYWKMNNLTAYYDRDANGDPIIVTKTLDQYYDDGVEWDLTEYIDTQDVIVQPSRFYSDIKFKYKDPSTFLAKEFEDINNYFYGNTNFSLRENDEGQTVNPLLPKKEYTVDLPFEQVLLENIQSGANNLTGIVYGWITDNSSSAVSLKPWIHYLELASAPAPILYRGEEAASSNQRNYVAATKYLREGSDFPYGDTITTLTYQPEVDERTLESSANTLFRNRYARTIAESYSRGSSVFTYKGRLPQYFLQAYTPADLIKIGADFYRIIEISTKLQDGKSVLKLLSFTQPYADNVDGVDSGGVRRVDDPEDFSVSITATGSLATGGEGLTAIASSTDSTFVWSTGETTPSITVTEPGLITVTATHTPSGSVATASRNVVNPSGFSAVLDVSVHRDLEGVVVSSPEPITGLNIGDTFSLTSTITAGDQREFIVGPLANGQSTAAFTFDGTISGDEPSQVARQVLVWSGETRALTLGAAVLPRVTTSTSVTGITNTMATLNGIVDGDGGRGIVESGFYYMARTGSAETSLLTLTTSGTRVTSTDLSSPFSFTPTTLTASTTYDFVAFARNGATVDGEVEGLGEVETFDTLAATNPFLSFNPTSLRFGPQGGSATSQSVTVTATNHPAGTITISHGQPQYVTGGTGWVSIALRSGTVFDITVGDFNQGSATRRVATIPFTSANADGVITTGVLNIEQNRRTTITVDYSDTAPASLRESRTAGFAGGVAPVSVVTNPDPGTPWILQNASDVPSWLSFSNTSASGTLDIGVTFDPNATGSNRSFEGVFVTAITNSNGQVVLEFPTGNTLPSSPSDGDTFLLLVQDGTNNPGLYRYIGSVWTLQEGVGPSYATFNFLQSGTIVRTMDVSNLSSSGGRVDGTLVVNDDVGVDGFALPVSSTSSLLYEVNVSPSGIAGITDQVWTISAVDAISGGSADWVTFHDTINDVAITGGTGDFLGSRAIQARLTANPGVSRVARITFSATGGGSETVTIQQEAAPIVLPTHVATLSVTNNIIGPREGYTIGGTQSRSGVAGATVTLTETYTLNPGYEWVTQPANISRTVTIVSGGNTVTATTTGQVRLIPVAPATRTATLPVTNNIPNTTISGQTGTSVTLTDTGTDGQGWNFDIAPMLVSGYRYTSSGNPTPSRYTRSGTFSGSDVSVPPVTFTGATELIPTVATTYDATLTVTNNISGPSAGYTITSDLTDSGLTGEPWSLSSTVTLANGYEWVGTPPTNFSESGTFGTEDVTRTHRFEGTVQLMVDQGATSIVLSPTAVSFTDAGGTATINVAVQPVGGTWTASFSRNDQAAFSVLTRSGTGNGTIRVSTSRNFRNFDLQADLVVVSTTPGSAVQDTATLTQDAR